PVAVSLGRTRHRGGDVDAVPRLAGAERMAGADRLEVDRGGQLRVVDAAMVAGSFPVLPVERVAVTGLGRRPVAALPGRRTAVGARRGLVLGLPRRRPDHLRGKGLLPDRHAAGLAGCGCTAVVGLVATQ